MRTITKRFMLAAGIVAPGVTYAHVEATSIKVYQHTSIHLIEIAIIFALAYCSLRVWRKRGRN
jgi:formate hydrogenlyase subunit 4